jgi:hypothetical protein
MNKASSYPTAGSFTKIHKKYPQGAKGNQPLVDRRKGGDEGRSSIVTEVPNADAEAQLEPGGSKELLTSTSVPKATARVAQASSSLDNHQPTLACALPHTWSADYAQAGSAARPEAVTKDNIGSETLAGHPARLREDHTPKGANLPVVAGYNYESNRARGSPTTPTNCRDPISEEMGQDRSPSPWNYSETLLTLEAEIEAAWEVELYQPLS